jgi:hypothetical protein
VKEERFAGVCAHPTYVLVWDGVLHDAGECFMLLRCLHSALSVLFIKAQFQQPSFPCGDACGVEGKAT